MPASGAAILGLGLRPIRLDEETVRRLGGLMVVGSEVDGPPGGGR